MWSESLNEILKDTIYLVIFFQYQVQKKEKTLTSSVDHNKESPSWTKYPRQFDFDMSLPISGQYLADDAWEFKELEDAITKGYF